MKLKITTLLAGLLSVAVFTPIAARACDGACGGGNNPNNTNGRHHFISGASANPNAGAGEGLNSGMNLSLDQNQQHHNNANGKNFAADHKKHKHVAGTATTPA